MALLTALGAAGLAYSSVLQENFTYKDSQFVIRVLYDICLASFFCLVAFSGLLIIYRRKLNGMREECRQLITKFLESHLGKPNTATSPGSHQGTGDREVALGTTKASGSPGSIDSSRNQADGEGGITQIRQS